jgi:AcrR family transcriptional regulator
MKSPSRDDAVGVRPYVMSQRARTTAATGERILESTVELFVELPYHLLTLGAIAARAGVTVQTVIRRFGDKESLVAQAAQHQAGKVMEQRSACPVGDLGAAVDNLLDHYAEAGDIALRLVAEEDSSPTVADITALGRSYHRDWCARVFAPTLEGLTGATRDRRLAQLVAVCDVYTWKLLHRDAGLSRRQTRTALLELLEPLTTSPGDTVASGEPRHTQPCRPDPASPS